MLHDSSFVLFSDGKPGGVDRYTVSRIQQQDDLRKVHLVILSACQTAQTESLSNGTEIQSMSAAFLRDRAKSVIASLWNVNDASTSLLMQNFYRNLATGKLTKAQALRQAQLQLFNGTVDGAPKRSDIEPRSTTQNAPPIAQSMRHPYYWAPFILIGNSN
jgi:CHAT domain-containing protein